MKSKSLMILAGVAILILILVMVGLFAHLKQCAVCAQWKLITPETARHYIQGFGPWAILIYVLLYIINTITLVPPIALMSLSAGLLFGQIWGTVALFLGSFCGTTATFFISRYLGGPLVDKFTKGKAAEFNERLSRSGFIVLLPIRLIGFPPYEFVNYACGLSKITYRDYISATMLGMSPAIIIQVLLADRIANFHWKDPVLYAAIILFVAMGVITTQIIKRRQGNGPK